MSTGPNNPSFPNIITDPSASTGASSAKAPPAAPPPPVRVLLEQSPWGGWKKKLMWGALGLSVLLNISLAGVIQSYFDPESEVPEKYHSGDHTTADKIAIITVSGTIMGGETFAKQQIDQVKKDKHVKAVVLRVDSPGGTVTGSDYLHHHLKQLIAERKIPMVVSMGSVAASGGYYIAMAAGPGEKRIFAEPTTWTGSIGVIIPHYDVSDLLKKWDVKDDSISSHPLKQMGSPTRMLPEPVLEEERKILKELVDESFAGFKQIVLDSRTELAKDPGLQETVFTGRIFTAPHAKRVGLVDELGFIEDAIKRAAELAKLDEEKVRVVKYKKSGGVFEALIGGETAHGFDPAALLELTSPKAYYMYSVVPQLLSTRKERE